MTVKMRGWFEKVLRIKLPLLFYNQNEDSRSSSSMKASQYAPFRIYFLFSLQLEAFPHTQIALETNTITRLSTSTTQKKEE